MKLIKILFVLAFTLLFVSAFSLFSLAAENETLAKLNEADSGLMSVSFRGRGTGEKENSAAAVAAAFKEGADMVSVSVQKEENGFFLSKSGDSLEIAAAAVGDDALLIVDDAWDFKDELVSFAKEKGFLPSIVLRTRESEKKLAAWCAENPGVLAVGIYGGNIVFNAISHLNTAKKAAQPLVQYQSKNYFNVMYQPFTASRYSAEENGVLNPRALAATYDENLCGKRGDNVVGWDELFDRGFSVIETGNIKGLVEYLAETERTQKELEISVFDAENADTSALSSVGAKNLEKALSEAKEVLKNKNSPLSALQSAAASLRASLYASDSTDSKSEKGSLNITAGKVVAVVFFGALIFAAQVFVFKKREKEKTA